MEQNYKAITIRQPWASLVATREKLYETRCWTTSYRGHLFIHSAANFPKDAMELCLEDPFKSALAKSGLYVRRDPVKTSGFVHNLPLGKILATCYLLDVSTTEEALEDIACQHAWNEKAFGDYSPGRFAWCLDQTAELAEPIATRGFQRIWNVSLDLSKVGLK